MSDKQMDVIRPTSAEEVAECISKAAQAKEVLAIAGNNTRCGLGNPVDAHKRLEMGGMKDLVFYDPKDLVMRVQAGMPLDEVEALLAKEQQYLPFEPPRFASLYGQDPAKSTIGGAVATALSGPRRLSAGGTRDFVLGIHAVNGQGEAYKAGGRTMKNVTGYDVSKFLTGSYGTLSVLTDVTLKLAPAPRTDMSLIVDASTTIDDDIKLFTSFASRPLGVTGLARLLDENGTPRLVIRLEGSDVGVKIHSDVVRGDLKGRTNLDIWDSETSAKNWQLIRELAPLDIQADDLVWRVNISVTQTQALINEARERGCLKRYYIDWGGNVIYATMRGSQPEIDLMHLRDLAKKYGAHAMMLRAPAEIRHKYGAFPPVSDGVRKLVTRTKSALDPLEILNPGRMMVHK